tara:strand:+ start:455 stop:766 length:312 start_codon:yes stop_codon:yes gene_type:complete
MHKNDEEHKIVKHDEIVKKASAANMRGQALIMRADGSWFTATIITPERALWPKRVKLADPDYEPPEMWPPPSETLLNGHLIERSYIRQAITSAVTTAIIYAVR